MLGRCKLVLFLVAVAALWAAPQASAHEFVSEASTTIVLGEQIGAHAFETTTTGTKINCGQATLYETLVGNVANELRFEPEYKTCALGGNPLNPTPVTMNGCKYTMLGETDANEHAKLQIECETGKKIQIHLGTGINACIASVVPQKVQGVHYVNEGTGSKHDIRISLTASNLWYEKSGGVLCQLFGNGKDLQITGTYTVRGFKDVNGSPGEQVGFLVL